MRALSGTTRASLAAGIAAALLAQSAAAQVKHEVSFEAAAGIEFDDNINVTQIDAETEEEDFAALLGAEADWSMEFGESDSLDLGYSLDYTQQFDVTQFDLLTQGLSAAYRHEFENFSAGISHNFFYSRLGGEGFLKLNRTSPSISFFATSKLFLRGAYVYQDKAFEDRTARDAETHMGEVSAFYFADGTDTFLSANYRFESEDAFAAQFDFDANIFKAGLHTRLPFAHDENRFVVSVEYEGRDYDAITPSIGEVRDDDRLTFDAEWEVPIGDLFYALAEYRYRDFDSNFPTSDFSENVASIQFGVRF